MFKLESHDIVMNIRFHAQQRKATPGKQRKHGPLCVQHTGASGTSFKQNNCGQLKILTVYIKKSPIIKN